MLCYIYAPKPCMLYVHVWCTYVGILASDSSAQSSRVQVAIQTLDENDNAPHLAEPYDMFVCDSAAPGQVSSRRRWVVLPRPPAAIPLKGLSTSSQLIQVIRALDRDEVGNSSQVSLQGPVGPDANFTVRDNRGGWPSATTPMPVSFLSLPHPYPTCGTISPAEGRCACTVICLLLHKPCLGSWLYRLDQPSRKVPQPPYFSHRRLCQPAAAFPPCSTPPGPLLGSYRTLGLGTASPEQHRHAHCQCVSLPAGWLHGILLARGSALTNWPQHGCPACHCHLYGHPTW